MKKLAKLILSLALVLTVLASATNYQAAEKATADMVNGYGWTAEGGTNYVYLYATGDETQSISSLTGQTPDVFAWWWVVLLEESSDGLYTVKSADVATNNNGISATLGEGKVAIMVHGDIAKTDKAADYDFLSGLKAGDTIKLGKSFNDIATQDWGSLYSVTIEKATAASTTPSTTPDAGSSNAGSNNAGSSNAGSNVPSTGDATPVVVMASMLFVAVAFVALGLKKRNA